MVIAQAEKIRKFILSNVEQHSGDIVILAMEKFGVTRTTIHRHLKTLYKKGLLDKEGTTNNTKYYLKSSLNKALQYSITTDLSESQVWENDFEALISKFPENIRDICYYGFTEIFNNAIDHSLGQQISVKSEMKKDDLIISIADNGIGIFKKIKENFHLEEERESILQLSKGKLTTDIQRHSGEGIFFSSRAFDSFSILANGLMYLRDNLQNDWLIEESSLKNLGGTTVKMRISTKSGRILKDIFKQFQNPETLAFDRTQIVIVLSLYKEDYFVSRSQAKRILMGVEKFKHVVLDFKGVRSVGQAFVDEVFRVFKNKYPEIEFTQINTNPDIDFMLKRGVATSAN